MEYNKIIVENVNPKEKIYTYLKRNGYSENYVKNLRKKEGYILLNAKIAHSDFILKQGDILELCKSPNTKSSVMPCQYDLDIVYEDDDIIIVNKPSGLSTLASKSHYSQNLSGAIVNYMNKKTDNFVVRIVGRLDKDTAGLVVIAKHSLICNKLSQNSAIKKTYLAIATGKIDERITIDKNIATTKNEFGYNNLKREISPEGKSAITYVTPIAYDGENTLIKAEIEYGRTHQIRLHLASIGHPLLGDLVYGNASDKISHSALACYRIQLYNELSGKNIDVHIPLPLDFILAFSKNIVEPIT